jgi:hypothetical protein
MKAIGFDIIQQTHKTLSQVNNLGQTSGYKPTSGMLTAFRWKAVPMSLGGFI